MTPPPGSIENDTISESYAVIGMTLRALDAIAKGGRSSLDANVPILVSIDQDEARELLSSAASGGRSEKLDRIKSAISNYRRRVSGHVKASGR